MADSADLKFYNTSYKTEQDTSWSVAAPVATTGWTAKDSSGNPISEQQWWASAGMGDYLPTSTPASDSAADEQVIKGQWDQLVEYAGIGDLGAPVNWWPGLQLQDPTSILGEQLTAMQAPDDTRFRQYWEPKDGPLSKTFTGSEPGQEVDYWIRYDPSRASQMWFSMTGQDRAKYNTMLVEAGLLEEGWEGLGDYTLEGAQAFQGALDYANYYGLPVDKILGKMGDINATLKDRRGGGGGGRGPTVKISIPDYDSMLKDAKDLIKQRLGRDPKDWEMSLIADEMKSQYGKWADAQKALQYGGNGVYEIPDPVKNTQQFFEETYANEISRIEDVGETRANNQMLLSAATKGFNMAGGFNVSS